MKRNKSKEIINRPKPISSRDPTGPESAATDQDGPSQILTGKDKGYKKKKSIRDYSLH